MKGTILILLAVSPTSVICFLNCYLPGDSMSSGYEFEVQNRNLQYFYMHHLDPQRFALFNHSHGRCLRASAWFHSHQFTLNIACLTPPFTFAENVSEVKWLATTHNIVCRLGKGGIIQREGLELYIEEKKTNKFGLLAINQEPVFAEVRLDDPSRVRYERDCSCHYRIQIKINYNESSAKEEKTDQRYDFPYEMVIPGITLLLLLVVCGIRLMLHCLP